MPWSARAAEFDRAEGLLDPTRFDTLAYGQDLAGRFKLSEPATPAANPTPDQARQAQFTGDARCFLCRTSAGDPSVSTWTPTHAGH